MPYIRVDLEVRTDPRWQQAPPVLRAAAKALYLDALCYSGELLTDGHVSSTVLAGLAAELGLQRRLKTVELLVSTSHFVRTKTGYFIPEWTRFFDSREIVQQRRIAAAKRQRSRRGQLQLGMSQRDEGRDVTEMSQRDTGRDSRGRERTQASAAAKEKDLTKAVELQHAGEPDPDAADEEPDIGDPGANGTALVRTIEELTPRFPEIPL